MLAYKICDIRGVIMPEIDEMNEFGFRLLEAIKHGLAEKISFPLARIDRDGSLIIMCKKGDEQGFDGLLPIFDEQCQVRGLTPIARHPFSSRTEKGEYVKYQFHLSADELDSLWMDASSSYAGYRYTGSILRLLEPEKTLLKDGVICLFPAQDIGNHQVILRIANCNTTETIATQLAFLLRKYNLQTENNINSYYGHHNNPVADRMVENDEMLLNIALSCIGIEGHHLHVQAEDGSTVISIPEAYASDVKTMSEEATAIYRALGVVSAEELPFLKSIEVPVSRYLEKTLEHLESMRKIEEENFRNQVKEEEHLQQELLILQASQDVNILHIELNSAKKELKNKQGLTKLKSELLAAQEELAELEEQETEYSQAVDNTQQTLNALVAEYAKTQVSLELAQEAKNTELEEAAQRVLALLAQNISQLSATLASEESDLIDVQEEIMILREKSDSLLATVKSTQDSTVTNESVQQLESQYSAAIAEPISQLEALKAQYGSDLNQVESQRSNYFLRSEISRIDHTIELIKNTGISDALEKVEKIVRYTKASDVSGHATPRRLEKLDSSLELARDIQQKVMQEQQSEFKDDQEPPALTPRK